MPTQKRIVTVTLDIECYDDLNVEDINWRELLKLEPGEDVKSRIKEFDPTWQCVSLNIATRPLILNKGFLIENEYFMAGGVAMYCRQQGYLSPH